MKRARPFAALCLCLALLGCAPASNLEICRAACQSARRCLSSSDSALQTCLATCDAKASQYQDQDLRDTANCTNASAVHAAVLDCYDTAACLSIAGCVTRALLSCTPR